MQRAVLELTHDDLYRNASFGIENWFASDPIIELAISNVAAISSPQHDCSVLQMIEHSDTNGKRTIFLDNMGVKTCEIKTERTLEKSIEPLPLDGLMHVHRTGEVFVCCFGAFAVFLRSPVLQPPKQEPVLGLEG